MGRSGLLVGVPNIDTAGGLGRARDTLLVKGDDTLSGEPMLVRGKVGKTGVVGLEGAFRGGVGGGGKSMPGAFRGGVGGGGRSVSERLTYWLGTTLGMWMGGGTLGTSSSASSGLASLRGREGGGREGVGTVASTAKYIWYSNCVYTYPSRRSA